MSQLGGAVFDGKGLILHYEGLIQYCLSLGIRKAYIQEEGTSSEDFVPPFDLQGVYPQ